MQVLPQLDLRVVGAGLVIITGWMIWQKTQAAVKKVDEVIDDATKPVAEVLSYFLARFNGWEPIEHTPLRLMPHYFTDDMRLTEDADRVLWKIDQYYPYLTELFGYRGGALKPQYYGLINVPLTKEALEQ
jgi:hypothetical protein